MGPVIVTLTSIPPRFASLGRTLHSLLRQRATPDRIELWLPETYRFRGFSGGGRPGVPEGVTICLSKEDTGPATKILPALLQHAGTGATLVYCDDDKVYAPDWLDGLLTAGRARPGAAIARVGCNTTEIETRHRVGGWRYAALPSLTGGLVDPLRRDRPREGAVDIALGYAGVLVRPGAFHAQVHAVEERFWAVDDIWLSAHLAAAGTLIHRIAPPTRVFDRPWAEAGALNRLRVDGRARAALDFDAMAALRDRFGIWPREAGGGA